LRRETDPVMGMRSLLMSERHERTDQCPQRTNRKPDRRDWTGDLRQTGPYGRSHAPLSSPELILCSAGFSVLQRM
jgi:hypothetical protein